MEDQEMQRSTDRILTTHAGSLLMPADLHAILPRQGGRPALRRASRADAGGRRAPGLAEALGPLGSIRVRL